ncbi:HK97 gp10 family phage protein [Cupriavidus respiraculi]|uniref:HK97 gp10 family phage protein n=1 Tax=Cupriavidus respiraculi TaxID=195930 RepID=A0ABM8XVM8_9BURK|nr:HK97 gp10 family phage protein [Cupriavidus respiraculi]CAG9184273.1 hypothetical protein LMG21510_05056 [Cupriavidus respiraculi]
MLQLKGDLVASLEALDAAVQEKVVRSAAHAGAVVFYEEARRLAPVYDGPPRPHIKPGQLRDSIYRAYAEKQSDLQRAVYQVSWNAYKAPHAHLLEYGHWRINKLVKLPDGWRALPDRLDIPVWVPGVAFIRRAGDRAEAAVEAMRQRAAQRLAEVLDQSAGQIAPGEADDD